MPHGDGSIIVEPARLSVCQLFRLVEIAHETSDYEIKKHALRLLTDALAPPLVVRLAPEA
jgi:hypothetical protein